MALFTPIPLFIPPSPKDAVMRAYISYSKAARLKEASDRPNSFLTILGAGANEKSKMEQWKQISKAFALAVDNGHYRHHPPSYWVLQKSSARGAFTGLIAGIPATQLREGKLRFHEATLEHRAERLGQYLETVKIQAEPIVTAFSGLPQLETLLETVVQQERFQEFEFEDNRFALWPLNPNQTKACTRLLSQLQHCDLVDGHHRAEAVLSYANKTNRLEQTQLLSMLLPATQIQSESFFWVLKNSKTPISIAAFEALGTLTPTTAAHVPDAEYPILIGIQGKFFSLQPKESSLLSLRAIYRYFSKLKGQLQYIPRKTTQSLAILKPEHGWAFCCSYAPLSFSEIQNIAASGEIVPPKTTFLHPKLLTGYLIHPMQKC